MASIYPFSEMEIGDSVIMADRKRGAVNMAAFQYRQKFPASRFSVQDAMAGIAITRRSDRTDIPDTPEPEPPINAYVATIDGCTIFYGPCTYAEARNEKVRCEETTGIPLVILMTEKDLGAGLLNTI